MRRALDPEVLDEAIGQHRPGALPTVEELTSLIAQVEVDAFRGNFDIDDELLATAWYLHGIASATGAAELYSLQRQTRAFRVSAHIFDLALNQTGIGLHSRLTYAFAAEVGYRRSELDPNATSVYRRMAGILLAGDERESPAHGRSRSGSSGNGSSSSSSNDDEIGPADPLLADIDLISLKAGVALLGLESGVLSRLLSGWRRQFAALSGLLGLPSVVGTMFGPASQVVAAASGLLDYLRRGNPANLASAQEALVSVLDLSAGEGDHDARWVAAHLLQITDGLAEASVWGVVPPDFPPAVAQAFTIAQPAVLALWPPQRELLKRATNNPLDPSTSRVLLSLPTSAGKTLLAQLLICSHLGAEGESVCYITPLRSLGREMRQALKGRLRVLSRELGAELPDWASGLEGLVTDTEPDVDVMTPERLMHALRKDPAAVLSRYSLFIVDEAHLIAQSGRGFLLESLLAFLSGLPSRLVLLSGVMGNAASIATWLSGGDLEVLYSSDWRGPRQVHALLYSSPIWKDQRTEPRRSKSHPVRVIVPTQARLRIRPAESDIRELYTSRDEPIGEKVFKLDAATQTKSRDDSKPGSPFYADVAIAASILLHAGSLLMVVSQRLIARKAAEVMAAQLPDARITRDLRAFLEDRLGKRHPLLGCVAKGVGYHHAGLPTDVLDALERALRSEELSAMVATSTLTDGVNLPVRTVIVSETTYEGQDPDARLSAPRLLNAVGRAGRAGRETEGWIVLALNKHVSNEDFAQLTPATTELDADSTLLSNAALDELAAIEGLLADTADAVLQASPGDISDFISYAWFVLATLERIAEIPSADELATEIGRLLGMHQLTPELRERWQRLAESVRTIYVETDAKDRIRWATTGTTLATARRIDEIVSEVVGDIEERARTDPTVYSGEMSLSQTLSVLFSHDVMNRLLELPEGERTWVFRTAAHPSAPKIEVDLNGALQQWVDGSSMSELADSVLAGVSNEVSRLEQMVDAVSGTFEHFLSWMVGVVVEHANTALEESNCDARLRMDVPAMIRYGVNTAQALALLVAGVQSRQLAHRIGRFAQAHELLVDDLRNTLAEMHIEGWRQAFDASPTEILDLLEYTRARRRSLLREILETGTASIEVRFAAGVEPGDYNGSTVTLVVEGLPPNVHQVVHDGRSVAVVTAADHFAVDDLLASGLEISLSLTDHILRFAQIDDAGMAHGDPGPDD